MEQTDTDSVEATLDSTTGTYTARFDWATSTPSIAVSTTLAGIEDTDPLSLPPLHDYVATDALDRLVGPEGSVRVEFEYVGYRVNVASTGAVTVEPLDEG
jgi:hypothetical protein